VTPARRPELRALAERLGIAPGYRDAFGQERETSDATRERLVRALGHEAGDETAARRACEAIAREDALRLVEPVLVWRDWGHAAPELVVKRGAAGDAREYSLELHLEDERVVRSEGRIAEAPPDASLALSLPTRPPPGYHEIRLGLDGPEGPRFASQRLVMAPRTAFQPEEALGDRRAFGVLANLYSLRGADGFGHGHFGDLAALARFAGSAGAAFIGLNPLHAVPNRGLGFAPYSPSSRLYRNVLYLDPEAVPELAGSDEARALLAEPALRRRRDALRTAARIDHESVLDAILPLLRALHRAFRRSAPAGGARADAYAAYRRREGEELDLFATWELLAERFAAPGEAFAGEWWRWPEPYRDPRSAAVACIASAEEEAIDFRRWLQFELDRQLAAAASVAGEAGCALGLYQDLALGASRASADTWMAPACFGAGASIGAPPDAYAPEGQDWGLPPLHPHRLRSDGYRLWSRILRAAIAHAGAVRLDHAMGLVRLFWIPEGCPGSEGAYVSYRSDELLGILALESRRQRAVVIAEDLGTLPAGLPELLADWGLLRSAVMRFEREEDGSFRPAERYPERALATLGTHDLPPLPGFLSGADLALRHAAGALGSDEALAAARVERDAEREALVRRLQQDGLLGDPEPDAEEIIRAAHVFLARAPSILLAASLDDLAGEQEPVNLPGVPIERHRSWSRRMSRPFEELTRCPSVKRRLAALRERSHDRGSGH
jgi:4-alpha-glucanotransferase